MRRPGPARRALGLVVAGAAYLLLACLAYWPVPPWSSTTAGVCACGDAGQQIWFLGWGAHALLSGLDPFFTRAIDAPSGVNMAVNTTVLPLGVLLAPVTAWLGPISSFNLALRLAPALSALGVFWVLRMERLRAGPAFVGGLCFGLCAYEAAQASTGHLNLESVGLLAPLCWLVLDAICRPARRPARRGLAIGVLAFVQLLVSAELLADAAVVVGVCAGIVVVVTAASSRLGPDRLAVLGRRVASVGAPALAVFLLLSAYPLWSMLAGPGHLDGPPEPIHVLANYSESLGSLVVPTATQALAPGRIASVGASLFARGSDLTEDGLYLGIPLLMTCVAVVVWRRRDRRVLLTGLFGALGIVLSMGPSLILWRRATGIALPMAVLERVPLLDGAVPARYSVFAQLAAASLLALGLDAALPARRRRRRTVQGAAGRLGLCTLWAGVALVPVVPVVPFSSAPAGVPSVFRTGTTPALGRGSVVLTYPYPVSPATAPMVWQAVDRFRFRLLGADALVPGPGGQPTSIPPPLAPIAVQRLLLEAFGGPSAPSYGLLAPGRLAVSAAEVDALRSFVRRWHVGTVLWTPAGTSPLVVLAAFRAAFGPPVRLGGVDLWRTGAGASGRR